MNKTKVVTIVACIKANIKKPKKYPINSSCTFKFVSSILSRVPLALSLINVIPVNKKVNRNVNTEIIAGATL